MGEERDEETHDQEENELVQDPEHLVEGEDDESTEQAREEGGLGKDPEDKPRGSDDKHHPS
jgi:hypothetical protein